MQNSALNAKIRFPDQIGRRLKWGLPVITIVLLLDRISKVIVKTNMHLYESIEVWGEFFKITFVKNKHAAFSINVGNYWILIGLTAIAIIFLLVYFFHSKYERRNVVALSLILGGAFGNFYDRLMFREVVDFLDFGIDSWRYATFNIADSSVVIGIMLLFLYMILDAIKK